MGSFAKSLAGVLFGWVSDVFSGIWALLTTDSGTESIPWFGRQWVLIVIILCLLGLVIDFVVYLYRWKPYRVWADFFKRRRRNKQADEDNSEYVEQEAGKENGNDVYGASEHSGINYQWTETEKAVYDSSTGYEPEPAEEPDYGTTTLEETDPYANYRRPGTGIPAENNGSQITTNDSWQIRSETENSRRNENRRQNTGEPRRRRFVRTLLGDDEQDEFEFSASSRPAPVINREDAYHEPVYPPQWKHNKQSGDSDIHDQGSV